MYMYMYIYIYIHNTTKRVLSPTGTCSLFLASSFRMCLKCEALKSMFPWRTRYPLS